MGFIRRNPTGHRAKYGGQPRQMSGSTLVRLLSQAEIEQMQQRVEQVRNGPVLLHGQRFILKAT